MASIVEDWMVLAVKKNGKLDYGFGPGPADFVRAGLLMEFVVRGAIGVTGGRDQFGEAVFAVLDAGPTGDGALDRALVSLGAGLPASIGGPFDELPDPTDLVAAGLVAAGVFEPGKRPTLADPARRDALAARISATPTDARSVAVSMLLGMGNQVSGWIPVFSPDLTGDGGQPIGPAVAEGLEAVMGYLAAGL